MKTPLRAALSVVIVLLWAAMAPAATFNVTIFDDVSDPSADGTCDSCSLREAVQEANALPGPDVINLPPGTYTMSLAGVDEEAGATGDLDITDDVTIIGIGTTTIDSHVGRILHVHGGNVSITGLGLSNGDANSDQNSGRAGGAVYNAPGSTLTLNLCTMSINTAQGGGGGIFNGGTLSLNGSTLTGNSANGSSRGGAVYNAGTMTVTNSTLDGNSSTDGGGAIFTDAGSILILNNVTITNNSSTGGVGGGGLTAAVTATVNLSNTVIANNTASGPNDDCQAAVVSSGGNLVEDTDGCTGLGVSDVTLVDPQLGSLQNNGGRTFTRLPQPGSQAIDPTGTIGCEVVDQRGLARPQGLACDTGAAEVFPACPVVMLFPQVLPDGQAGTYYSQAITPAGGVAPYRFAVTSGNLPKGLVVDPLSGTLSGVPTESGGHGFEITAFDANLCPGSFSFSLDIMSGPSCSPTDITLSPTVLPIAIPGEDYSQLVTATGGSAPHQYTVTDGILPPGLALDLNTGAISGQAHVSGTFVFVATATDANTCTGNQGYALQVQCFLTFLPAQLTNGTVGTPYAQPLSVSAGGTAPIAFAVVSGALPPGMSLTGTGMLSGTPTVPGTYPFLVEATDANFCTGKVGYVLTVDPCLEISPTILPTAVVGTAYATTVTAAGGTGSSSFAVTAGSLPSGLDLDASGQLSGTADTPGTSFFTVEATDGTCSVERDYFLVVNPAACPAITITPATLPGGTVGDSYNQNLSASGGTGPYTFQLVSGVLPTGLDISANGNLTGTLLASGSFTFTLAATNAGGCTGTQSYTVLVIPAVCPSLDLFPSLLPDAARGVVYAQPLLAGGGIAPYTYAVVAGTLPDGLLLDAATGVLSGTPTTLGDSTFSIGVTDATSCTGTFPYTMHVLPDLRGANCALFGDTFENDVLATDWVYVKPGDWSESAGVLVGKSGKKAVATAAPAFAGCQTCTTEATLQVSGGGKVSLLGWYVDKRNNMELIADSGGDVWQLRERVNGTIVAKAKASKPIDPNVQYAVRISFDGTKFDVFVDDFDVPLLSLTPKKAVPSGTVGFQAAATTGTFSFVCVN